jgi:hypothetical protein
VVVEARMRVIYPTQAHPKITEKDIQQGAFVLIDAPVGASSIVELHNPKSFSKYDRMPLSELLFHSYVWLGYRHQ